MLRSVKNLESYGVKAEDGEVGTVSDFYFDDKRWTIRYLVTETGTFFSERKVLISPISFRSADWATQQFHVALTRDKVKSSPDIDLHQPVSRQNEREYYRFYGWPYYWGYSTEWSWGLGDRPDALAAEGSLAEQQMIEESDDPHLRSALAVTGYHVQGTDGEIGHIADLIVDDVSWDIRYLVIDTSNWWMGKKVLVAPQWAAEISWEERKVFINLPREVIRKCPEWDAAAPVNRDYELRMFDYYGRPAYWLPPPTTTSSRI